MTLSATAVARASSPRRGTACVRPAPVRHCLRRYRKNDSAHEHGVASPWWYCMRPECVDKQRSCGRHIRELAGRGWLVGTHCIWNKLRTVRGHFSEKTVLVPPVALRAPVHFPISPFPPPHRSMEPTQEELENMRFARDVCAWAELDNAAKEKANPHLAFLSPSAPRRTLRSSCSAGSPSRRGPTR